MVLLSAPFPENTAPLVSYPASVAVAAGTALLLTVAQLLCWRSRQPKWLRLMPLWVSLCGTAVSFFCVICRWHPYEMGFALFCTLAALLGCLAGLGLGAVWKKPRK